LHPVRLEEDGGAQCHEVEVVERLPYLEAAVDQSLEGRAAPLERYGITMLEAVRGGSWAGVLEAGR
jgi:hypothetical protein